MHHCSFAQFSLSLRNKKSLCRHYIWHMTISDPPWWGLSQRAHLPSLAMFCKTDNHIFAQDRLLLCSLDSFIVACRKPVFLFLFNVVVESMFMNRPASTKAIVCLLSVPRLFVCRDPVPRRSLPAPVQPARGSLGIDTVLSRNTFRLSTGEQHRHEPHGSNI